MDIGTGKDLHEYTLNDVTIPSHLIDIADPTTVYTLFHFKEDFIKAYDLINSRSHLPVLTGGTGLYIEAVLRDYQIPSISENRELRLELMKKEKSWLKDKLKNLNPELFNRTDINSKKRIVRSLEVALHKKEHPDPLQAQTCTISEPLVLCTRWERDRLRERIDRRLHDRLENGMIEEVRRLLQSGIPPDRFALFGMEYKHISRYLDGVVSYQTMVEMLRHDIHRLAKRQETWFRGMERRGIKTNWIPDANLDSAIEVIEGEWMNGK